MKKLVKCKDQSFKVGDVLINTNYTNKCVVISVSNTRTRARILAEKGEIHKAFLLKKSCWKHFLPADESLVAGGDKVEMVEEVINRWSLVTTDSHSGVFLVGNVVNYDTLLLVPIGGCEQIMCKKDSISLYSGGIKVVEGKVI